MVRICFSNINNIGQTALSHKSLDIQDFITRRDIDIFGMTELGVNWKNIPMKDTLWERTSDWFDKRRISYGYNLHDISGRRSQHGGTALLAVNDIVKKINTCGTDTSGLGRWSWILMRGKNWTVTRIISAYCPVRSSKKGASGQRTVSAQHIAVLHEDPIERFFTDLSQAVRQWKDKGENIILGGDWNRSITGQFMKSFAQTCGLTEALTFKYGSDPPPTYQRGTTSLDGIFVSSQFLGVSGGYLEYGDAPCDLRGTWIDVPQAAFLGYKIPITPVRPPRKLTCHDPRTVRRYQSTLHDLYLKHNVYGRIWALKQQATYPLPAHVGSEWNSIDSVMAKCMKEAEKKCRKVFSGGQAWSPILQSARNEIHLWSLVLRRLKGCAVHARTIIRARKKTRVRSSNVNLETAIANLATARRRYRAIKKKDKAHRQSFLENLAQSKAEENNSSMATELRNMSMQEQQRRMSRRTKHALKRNEDVGTTRIQVKTPQGLVDVTNKEEMEHSIINENEKKYHQTEERCPLLQGQLLDDLGILGDGPAVPKILNGTYECPPGTPAAVRMWLQTLYIPNRDNREATLQSMRDYRKGWNLAREHTASGELHFGHYKAGSQHDMICWANYVMSSLPRSTGFSPQRWLHGTDVMLLKKEGFFLLEKLRTIVLMESDFNYENKRLGKEAMTLALEKNMITDEQYSRPGRSSQDNALNKRLFFDHQRLRRQSFGVCACDLKSCYDRIVHNAAALALRRVGVRESDLASMFYTIQHMCHTVRTAFGESRSTYSADNPDFRLPVQGLYQGNGAGPSIWSILCSTIFETLHAQGYSSIFCYALSRGLYELCGFAYVDDCDLFFLGNTADEVIEGLQDMLTLWDHLMEVTGAAIAPDKCWWYLIEFQWTNGRWKGSDEGETFTLEVRNKKGDIEALRYLRQDEAMEMLGVHLAPNGSEKKQLTVMREKSEEWSRSIKDSYLSRYEVWTAFTTGILKSLEYPLAATSFSQTQLRHITSPAIVAGLQRSGYCKSIPRPVVFGPRDRQGMGIQNLYHSQSIRHVKDIIDQTWKRSPSEKFIRMNIEAWKLEAGIHGPMFCLKTAPRWMNTPNLWLTSTLEFCTKYKIQFQESGTSLGLKRVHDKMLMETIDNLRLPSPTMKAINRCRMFLRVTTLSDITNGDGHTLHPNTFNHVRFGKRDNWSWPPQGMPDTSDWKHWDAAVRTSFLHGQRLLQPLSHWTLPPETYKETWDFFLTSDNKLIQHNENQWYTYHPIDATRRRLQFDSQQEYSSRTTPPRGTLWRTTVVEDNGKWTCLGKDYTVSPMEHLPRTTDIRNFIRSLPDSAWLFDTLIGIEHLESLNPDGPLILTAVSDGSYIPDLSLGSAAWCVVVKQSPEVKIIGGGIVPGTKDIQSAYRSELAGLYGVVLFCRVLFHVYPNIPELQIGCDGKSALMMATARDRYNVSSGDKSADILCRIISALEILPVKIIAKHVKGHQELQKDILTVEEKLNVEMDALANLLLDQAIAQHFTPPTSLPYDPLGLPCITTHNGVITSQIERSLKTHVAAIDTTAWWIAKGRLTHQSSTMVDWTLVGDTMSALPWSTRRFVIKWTTDMLPVGKRQKKIKAMETARCPRCTCIETTWHVARCPNSDNRNLRNTSLRQMDSWLRKLKTDPNIVRALMLILPQWYDKSLPGTYCPILVSNEVKTAIRMQHTLGWDNFMTGFWVTHWADIQNRHFKRLKLRYSGRRWAAKVSSRLWQILKSHWDHRNSIMYRNNIIDDLRGKQELLYACQLELDIGLQDLDDVFAIYFDTDIDSLEDEDISDIKSWFSTIRGAREKSGWIYHDHDRVSDSLRQWVGLSMEKRFRKSTPT